MGTPAIISLTGFTPGEEPEISPATPQRRSAGFLLRRLL